MTKPVKASDELSLTGINYIEEVLFSKLHQRLPYITTGHLYI